MGNVGSKRISGGVFGSGFNWNQRCFRALVGGFVGRLTAGSSLPTARTELGSGDPCLDVKFTKEFTASVKDAGMKTYPLPKASRNVRETRRDLF